MGSSTQTAGGADKHSGEHNYLNFYEHILKGRPASSRLLELGVNRGDSIFLWGTWFCQGEVFGVDILPIPWSDVHEPQLRAMLPTAQRTAHFTMVQADGTDPVMVTKIEAAAHVRNLSAPQFDIIIDDALHKAPDRK